MPSRTLRLEKGGHVMSMLGHPTAPLAEHILHRLPLVAQQRFAKDGVHLARGEERSEGAMEVNQEPGIFGLRKIAEVELSREPGTEGEIVRGTGARGALVAEMQLVIARVPLHSAARRVVRLDGGPVPPEDIGEATVDGPADEENVQGCFGAQSRMGIQCFLKMRGEIRRHGIFTSAIRHGFFSPECPDVRAEVSPSESGSGGIHEALRPALIFGKPWMSLRQIRPCDGNVSVSQAFQFARRVSLPPALADELFQRFDSRLPADVRANAIDILPRVLHEFRTDDIGLQAPHKRIHDLCVARSPVGTEAEVNGVLHIAFSRASLVIVRQVRDNPAEPGRSADGCDEILGITEFYGIHF